MFNERRKLEDQNKSEKRLPPGQSLTLRFPVLHYGPVPVYPTLDQWNFKVWGLVEKPITLNWKDFTAIPTRTLTLDIHCVTRWSKFDTMWEGVHFKDMLDAGLIKLKPEAKFCVQHCEYGFTVNLPVDVMLSDNFLFAYKYDGKPLEPDHGYPLRGIMG